MKEQSQPKHAKRKGKPGKKEDKEIWIFPTKSYEEVKMKMETASNPIRAVVGSAKTKQKKTVFESFNGSEPPPPKVCSCVCVSNSGVVILRHHNTHVRTYKTQYTTCRHTNTAHANTHTYKYIHIQIHTHTSVRTCMQC